MRSRATGRVAACMQDGRAQRRRSKGEEPVMMQVDVHRVMMVRTERPTFFIVAAEARASGKLDKKTPTTKTSGFLEPLLGANIINVSSRVCKGRGEG